MKIIETAWNWTSVLQQRSMTNLIVLHHAAAVNCTAAQVDAWHKANGWSGIGYHFFIRKNGEIYRGRPLWAVGSHAQGNNSRSIGICAEGNYDTETVMPTMQRESIEQLLSYLKEIYPNADIKAHSEVGVTGCPGNAYPLNAMKEYFKKAGNVDKGELTMTQYEELKEKDAAHDKIINTMGQEIEDLKNKTQYYNKVSDVPVYYRPTIKKLVDKGRIEGDENENLMLTPDMMRILTILDRQGIFG